MVMLKIISQPEKLQEVLKTNRPLGVGQVLYGGSDEALRALARAYPELVEVVGEERQPLDDLPALSSEPVKPEIDAQPVKHTKPRWNKMLKRSAAMKMK